MDKKEDSYFCPRCGYEIVYPLENCLFPNSHDCILELNKRLKIIEKNLSLRG